MLLKGLNISIYKFFSNISFNIKYITELLCAERKKALKCQLHICLELSDSMSSQKKEEKKWTWPSPPLRQLIIFVMPSFF